MREVLDCAKRFAFGYFDAIEVWGSNVKGAAGLSNPATKNALPVEIIRLASRFEEIALGLSATLGNKRVSRFLAFITDGVGHR